MTAIYPAIRPAIGPAIRSAFEHVRSTKKSLADQVRIELFGAGEIGGMWDFTDIFTLSQDAAGTVPVTATGRYIGRVSDLSGNNKHATQATGSARPVLSGIPTQLGAECVVNGRFATADAWTAGTGWSITAGAAVKSAGAASVISQTISVTGGTAYFVTYSMTRAAGSVQITLTGGTSASGLARSDAGSWSDVIVANAGNVTLEISANAEFAGSISNVSIRPATAIIPGAYFDGVNDILATQSIDLSNSAQATLIIASSFGQDSAPRSPAEFGDYYSHLPGSISALFKSRPAGRLRGVGSAAEIELPADEGASSKHSMQHVIVYEADLSKSTISEQLKIWTRGVLPAQSPTGTTAGSGNMANAPLVIGAANIGGFLPWQGYIHRVILVGRVLTAQERVLATAWAKIGTPICAVLGDSTVAVNNPAYGLSNASSVASLAGIVYGAADVSLVGDRIANQKTRWLALPNKTALQAVFVQIGLNDIKSRVGEGSATAAQVIADLQDLIATVNAGKPAGCKTYVCGLTPAKKWLDGATNPTAAYAGWLAVNDAIGGGGATPILGVDGRITSHVADLDDGTGRLRAIYDVNNDGVHESTEARFIIAQAWRAQLASDGLLAG